MKRRDFVTSTASLTLSVLMPSSVSAMGEKRDFTHYAVSGKKRDSLKKIGSRTLEQIRDNFKYELFDKTIPLWKKSGVDWKYGGYFTQFDENDNPEMANKQLYYQTRMLWLYSYFYTHFDKDDFHLQAAKNGFDFLTKYCVDEKFDWFTEVTREGAPVIKFYDIYASIYMILGLGEFYHATGIEEARDLAVKTAYRVTEIALSPTYQAQGHGPWYEPGTKRLGTWLHFLNALTPLLKYTEDPGVEKIAKMCVRNILNRHWQPEGYAFETLQADFTPYPNDLFIDDEEKGYQNQARWVNNFHTMEAAWMVMEEALRVGNRAMFEKGMELGKFHLENYWVERSGEKGIIQFLRPDDPDPTEGRDICKPYVFKEIFIMLLLILEHRHEDWAVEWFEKSFSYACDKPLPWPWRDTLHQPRGAMYCYEILERMIERNGRVSGFFDSI